MFTLFFFHTRWYSRDALHLRQPPFTTRRQLVREISTWQPVTRKTPGRNIRVIKRDKFSANCYKGIVGERVTGNERARRTLKETSSEFRDGALSSDTNACLQFRSNCLCRSYIRLAGGQINRMYWKTNIELVSVYFFPFSSQTRYVKSVFLWRILLWIFARLYDCIRRF